MVERLKAATAKARERREENSDLQQRVRGEPGSQTKLWSQVDELRVESARMEEARIVSFEKSDPAHAPFDLLRTNVLKILRDHGWSRIGITSATPACGKTLISTNLAFSLARNPAVSTLLLDLDLRSPQLASRLDQNRICSLPAFLRGEISLESFLCRIGSNLALGLNSDRVLDVAELMQRGTTQRSLNRMVRDLAPDVALFDLPPLLLKDDALSMLQYLDCVLVVASAGKTTGEEILECEKLLEGGPEFLGVILNNSETEENYPFASTYYYQSN